jgi:hypothetical protein
VKSPESNEICWTGETWSQSYDRELKRQRCNF